MFERCISVYEGIQFNKTCICFFKVLLMCVLQSCKSIFIFVSVRRLYFRKEVVNHTNTNMKNYKPPQTRNNPENQSGRSGFISSNASFLFSLNEAISPPENSVGVKTFGTETIRKRFLPKHKSSTQIKIFIKQL
jgi:hypothetical protein